MSLIATVLGALVAQPRRWARMRRTRQALEQLSDRSLKDIGLHRSEIPSVAAAHGDRRRSALAASGFRTWRDHPGNPRRP